MLDTNKSNDFYCENTFASSNCSLFSLDFAITTEN